MLVLVISLEAHAIDRYDSRTGQLLDLNDEFLTFKNAIKKVISFKCSLHFDKKFTVSLLAVVEMKVIGNRSSQCYWSREELVIQ